MKKQTFADTVVVEIDGVSHTEFCGEAHRLELFEFLRHCEDEQQVLQVMESRPIRNYVCSYGQFPEEGKYIFRHGHRASFLGVTQDLQFLHKKESKPLLIDLVLNKEVLSLCSNTPEEAKNGFHEAYKFKPPVVAEICTICESLYGLIDTETDQRTYSFGGEITIQV